MNSEKKTPILTNARVRMLILLLALAAFVLAAGAPVCLTC